MMRCKIFRTWHIPCILVGMLALAIIAGLAQRARGAAGASAEVISNRPIRAVQGMPGGIQGAVAPVEVNGQARVEVPVDFYDFGPLSATEVVRRDFLVINRGSADLLITRAYTTCGCTTAQLSASVIPPGKASRVTVIFDAGFHPISGKTSPSAVQRGLVLETNDPNHPQAEIWVQASVGR